MKSRRTKKLNVCSVMTQNRLAQARVMVKSLRKFHPNATVVILVLDRVTDFTDSDRQLFEIVRPNEIGINARFMRKMQLKYTWFEIACILKSRLMRHLLFDRGQTHVFYMDTDLQFFHSIDREIQLLKQNNILLTPHLLFSDRARGPMFWVHEAGLLAAGDYNAGFIGARHSAETLKVLDWWFDRCLYHCKKYLAGGINDDQKWLNYWPILFNRVAVSKNPGLNVAYWNMHERDLEVSTRPSRLHITTRKQPLVFMHFSGFDIKSPHILGPGFGNKINLTWPIAPITRKYAAELISEGYLESRDF